MGLGWQRAVAAAKESRHKTPCPVCGKPYTERNKNRYRHFDRQTGAVTWCKDSRKRALTEEDAKIIKRMAYLRRLLKQFGATLSGYDPGITAYLPKVGRGDGYMGESLTFDGIEWEWLEPLLKELRTRRRRESWTIRNLAPM